MKLFPPLYFVTPPLGDVNAIERLIYEVVEGGVQMVQIRDKGSVRKIIEVARRIHPFLQKRNVPLIINDRVDIAHVVKAEGVHVGQSDLSLSEVRTLLGPECIVGISIENEGQLGSIAGADYVAASPLFATKSKEDSAPPIGLKGLRALREAISLPLIAIGGIDLEHLPAIVEAGIDGIAVVSALASAADPRARAAAFLKAWERLQANP